MPDVLGTEIDGDRIRASGQCGIDRCEIRDRGATQRFTVGVGAGFAI